MNDIERTTYWWKRATESEAVVARIKKISEDFYADKIPMHECVAKINDEIRKVEQ